MEIFIPCNRIRSKKHLRNTSKWIQICKNNKNKSEQPTSCIVGRYVRTKSYCKSKDTFDLSSTPISLLNRQKSTDWTLAPTNRNSPVESARKLHTRSNDRCFFDVPPTMRLCFLSTTWPRIFDGDDDLVKVDDFWKVEISTPPKTNMEPENGPLEKEIPIGNHHFQVPCFFGGDISPMDPSWEFTWICWRWFFLHVLPFPGPLKWLELVYLPDQNWVV